MYKIIIRSSLIDGIISFWISWKPGLALFLKNSNFNNSKTPNVEKECAHISSMFAELNFFHIISIVIFMKLKLLFISSLFFYGCLKTANAQELFTGVWGQGTGGHFLWAGANWSDFYKKWNDLRKQNLRLVNIKTYTYGGQRLFAGIWNAGSDPDDLTRTGLNWSAFNKVWQDNAKRGLRLINVETYEEGSTLYFLGVFRAGNDRHLLTPLNLDWTAFQKFWDDSSKTGLRLINIESYLSNGKRCYLGVFRAGTDGYVLSPNGKDWHQFEDYWKVQSPKLRLIDLESFVENGKRIYLGVWREGSGGNFLWSGVDWENFTSKWAENSAVNMRLLDLETYESNCDGNCLNHALMPDNITISGRDSYDYGIFAGPQHCEGPPGTCPSIQARGSVVLYRWPNLKIGSEFYLRSSVLYDAKDQIFTLPFNSSAGTLKHNAWLYSPGSWHHAIDYSRSDKNTFQVCAAAPGKVIYIGWDPWSGNTIIISHDAGGKKDVYRTIYMHLQNGPLTDCQSAWTKTVPSPVVRAEDVAAYKIYLNNTGCYEDKKDTKPSERNLSKPKEDYWGMDEKKIDMSLLGKTVAAGQVIAWSGSTGPGGCGCVSGGTAPNTHLHIFFAHRDPQTKAWYLIDPYGIYSYPDCYPKAVDGAISSTSCNRYPVTWKSGNPKYAQ